MKRRSVSGIILSLSLAMGVLAGCGGEEAGGTGEDTIKIGANLELSGGAASYGQSIMEGMELAIDEINKDGINGKKLEIEKYDNKSDAAEATTGALKLVTQEKADVIVGAATSTNTLAQVDIANEHKVPLITPTGTNETITVNDGKVNEYVFRTCFIDPFQGTVAANFAKDQFKAKTAAIYIDSSSDYSKGLAAAFKKSFTDNGGKIVAEEAFVQKDTDFQSTLTRIKKANPDFVFVPAFYEEVGLILKQGREIGLDVPFMGGDGWDSPKLLEIAGEKSLENTFITNHYSSGDPAENIQKFVTAFQEKYNDKSPDAFAALGYDTAYFIADAVKRAGDDPTPEKIQKALAETDGLDLVSGKLTIDENHNPIKAAAILKYENGKQIFETNIKP